MKKKNIEQDVIERLTLLEERVEKIYYAPGNPGFIEAEESFRRLSVLSVESVKASR